MKSYALSCVIGWLAFWTFGVIAVVTQGLHETQIITAAILAFGGLLAGMTSYLKLCRECS